MRDRLRRLLPVGWLFALLCVPAISLALGARQPLLDNRPKTPWPRVSAADLRHRATYERLDAALLERLPTRKAAVQAHAQISVDLFGESTNPDVSVGRRGWLYYTKALRPCREAPPTGDPAEAVQIAYATITAAGRKALIMEPADKLLIHPQDAPRWRQRDVRCITALQRRVEQRITTLPGGVNLDAELRRIEASGRSAFLPHDSHWSFPARLAYARAILDFVRPGLARDTGLHLGPWFERRGDLAVQLGLPDADHDRAVLLRRPVREPVEAGKTLVLGDSQDGRVFTDPPMPGAPPLAGQLPAGTTFCRIVEDFSQSRCNDALYTSSRIAIESAGRNLDYFESACTRLVGMLAGNVPGDKGYFALEGGSAVESGGDITIGDGGTVILRIAPVHGDVQDHARIFHLPIKALAPGGNVVMVQRPRRGRPVPCAYSTSLAGEAPILPLPAGRRASDLTLVISAPPGTVLGRPDEVSLARTDALPGPRAAG
jgi:hypothetical protein